MSVLFPNHGGFTVIPAGRLAGVALIAGVVAACARPPDSATTTPTATVTAAPAGQTGAAFTEPMVRRSANGVLETNLTLAVGKKAIAGRVFESGIYEGGIPGPTLRIKPGDRLKIHFANNLKFPDGVELPAPPVRSSRMSPGMGMDHVEGPEGLLYSNLHTHGLQVSPTGNGDNPFLLFKPGEAFDYDIQVPADQPAGLHWYHPHRHGSSAKQGWAGLGGAIVVEGAIDHVPEVAAAKERLILLQEIWVDDTGHLPMGLPIPTAGEVPFSTIPAVPTQMYYLVNGTHQPLLTVAPGSIERWRISNESPHKFMRLSLDGHTMHQIAQDGIAFTEPKAKQEMLLAPGNRAEVLVQVGPAGTYRLKSLAYDQGHPGGAMPEVLLATIVSAGAPQHGRLPTKLVAEYPDISKEPIAARRRVVFSGNAAIAPVRFYLDDKLFDAARSDANVRVGTVEEWTLVNDDVYQHPFHIHVNPFQVIEINGRNADDHVWWDTFPLPPKGSIKVRMKFRPDVTGKTVYHCHILPHEDNGMMSAFTLMPAGGGTR